MDIQDYLQQDVENMLKFDLEWEKLQGKSILVTGATGLLGTMICKALSAISIKKEWEFKIFASARNIENLKKRLGNIVENQNVFLLEQDIKNPIKVEGDIDYIIHTASPTASQIFINNPVETVEDIVIGTNEVLRFARENQCKSIVYLSSMEVYGQILDEKILKPKDVGYINPINVRSSYSEGKRMAENLCIGYFQEYDMPVKIVRLAQTFGPGIAKTDKRVFAQFLSSALNNQDITLFTTGGAKRMYLDTMDAVSACLAILLNGESGQVYNAANPDTYCSIKDMAEMVLKEYGNEKCQVIIDESKNIGQYPPDNMLRLDVSLLQKLGWKPQYGLKEMYGRMN